MRVARALVAAFILMPIGMLVIVVTARSAWACTPAEAEVGLCSEVDVVITVPSNPDPGPDSTTSSWRPDCAPVPRMVSASRATPGGPRSACATPTRWIRSRLSGARSWESVAAAATDGTLMACNGSGDIFYVPEGQNPIPDARTIALNAVKQVPFVTAEVHTAPVAA